MRNFKKRTFTLTLLAGSLGSAATHLPTLVTALVRPATSPALREKVMLGVTAVNDCRYCTWVHTGLALSNGVDLDDLQNLIDNGTLAAVVSNAGNFVGNSIANSTANSIENFIDRREAVAILFAKHFADTTRAPSAAALTALASEFTDSERKEIMAYIHAIYFANLAGNSADAWLVRFSGGKVIDGNPLAEAIAAVLAAPVLGLIAMRSRNSRPEALDSL